MQNAAYDKASRVRLMVFDVDGILTDGKLLFGPEGEIIKVFHVLDGQGFRLLEKAGIKVAIITARQSPMVQKRAEDLGVEHVYMGAHDKRRAFSALLEKTGFTPADCGYIGDDLIDLPVLLQVGFSASVPNAHSEVRNRVDYVTHTEGGYGAAREICDLILKAQGKYQAIMETFLQ